MKGPSQSELIEAFMTNNSTVLKKFYTVNYYKCESYILKNNGTHDLAKDTYQEAFLSVWKNIKANKFQPKNDTALQGYLYTITKHKWMDYLRSSTYKNSVASNPLTVIEDVDEAYDTVQDAKLNAVVSQFKTLGEPCKSLLTAFYFSKSSLREIAEKFNIGEASARNKKYRCMEKLRALVLAQKS